MQQANEKCDKKLYLETPTILSFPLSSRNGFDVYLKLDNLQPPGSFKIRGMSNLIQKGIQSNKCEHVYCASGGNAGMAAAYTSKQLGVPCTIVLPTTTPAFIADRLRFMGAEVKIHGEVYDKAKVLAEELASKPGGLYAPAFEHPDLWEGHASLIKEASGQLPCKPDVVVTCVGGGGLINGIIEGMREVGWEDVPIIGMETQGAHAFSAAIAKGQVVNIGAITSIAKSLGSLTISPKTLEYYQEAKPPIISYVTKDKDAVNAISQLAEDHRFLVEPACGASMAAVYSGVIQELQKEGKLGEVKSVLVEVCGGAIVSMEMIDKWKEDLAC